LHGKSTATQKTSNSNEKSNECRKVSLWAELSNGRKEKRQEKRKCRHSDVTSLQKKLALTTLPVLGRRG